MASGERLKACGIELEVLRRGTGRPILLLHGFQTVDPEARFLELLARHGEIIAPSSPGFGHSPRPKDFDTVYDLVHLYLELLDTLPGGKVTLVGFSFGGWLAAEVAVACSHRLDKLVLVDPLGDFAAQLLLQPHQVGIARRPKRITLDCLVDAIGVRQIVADPHWMSAVAG